MAALHFANPEIPIMKKLLLAALFALLPAAAQAVSSPAPVLDGSFTGKVVVTQVMCIRAPCYPIVEVVGAKGQRIGVSGMALRDIQAFEGRTITVKGSRNVHGAFEVESFAPGKSSEFVSGIVRDRTRCTRSLPPQCPYAAGIATAQGEVEVTDPAFAKKLSRLDGAEVIVKGRVFNKPCPAGRVCIALYQPVLDPDERANIFIKGRLSPAYHIMRVPRPGEEWANYFLTVGGEKNIAIYSKKNWSNRLESVMWLAGRFDGDKFRATKSSDSVAVDPAIEPLPWDGPAADGANVSREGNTTGGVVAQPEVEVRKAEAAGYRRD